jgi:hypothetical protein
MKKITSLKCFASSVVTLSLLIDQQTTEKRKFSFEEAENLS